MGAERDPDGSMIDQGGADSLCWGGSFDFIFSLAALSLVVGERSATSIF